MHFKQSFACHFNGKLYSITHDYFILKVLFILLVITDNSCEECTFASHKLLYLLEMPHDCQFLKKLSKFRTKSNHYYNNNGILQLWFQTLVCVWLWKSDEKNTMKIQRVVLKWEKNQV